MRTHLNIGEILLRMINIKQAVILAGGQGKRLLPFTLKNPKPLVMVNKKPFLEHLINLLKDNGIREVVILTGFLGEKINEYFGDGKKFGIKIKYSQTPFLDENGQENESGLRIKNAEELLNDHFLLMYCDNYWPLQLKKLIDFYNGHPSDVLITAYSNLDKSTRSNLFIDENGYAIKYDSTRSQKDLNGVDIGFFIVNKKVLDFLPKSNSKFETRVLQSLIPKRKLSGYLTNQKYYSIGDMKRVKLTEKFLTPKKVMFLDRDGVINKRPLKADYVKKWEEFEFLPGSIEAIKLLTKSGYKIFIISNQPGIARGAMTKKDLELIHKKMLKVLKSNGGKIEGIYSCLHNWDDGCICRKPKPGLLYFASRDHFVDLTKVIFVGDDTRDKEAGDAAGCKTILIKPEGNLLDIVKDITKS